MMGKARDVKMKVFQIMPIITKYNEKYGGRSMLMEAGQDY